MTMWENEDDRGRERAAFGFIQEKTGATLVKLPKTYTVDFAALRDGKVVSFGEYKYRNMAWGDYKTIVLSLKKFLAATQLYETTMYRTYFYVEDKNGDIRYVDITTASRLNGAPRTVTVGGRTKLTRDFNDIEPVCHIPVNQFSKLGVRDGTDASQ